MAVAVARVVVVGQDYDVSRAKELPELRLPFTRAAGVTGSNKPNAGEPVSILLAFDDEHDTIGGGAEKLRKAVRHAPNALYVADPSRVAIGGAARAVGLRFDWAALESAAGAAFI